ncbi:hypothetical protein THAOC_11538 [Thalassiosira oceanica]|uniref:Uncharacterized protein n=1 Tax=Thalassiosira oceanica TaxID=159749 RepID=K0SQ13_THAOC|nr:hypothetical protein THAOC_11538 [Thalassiosira oceanica]|eukprot:EJK67430.1 hypothetical protein THAOC_11538 [Thalassiosira oceanica]
MVFDGRFLVDILARRKNIRVASVKDRNDRGVEELSARRAQFSIVAAVVVDRDLRKHGEVLDLGLTKGRAVRRDENKLGLASSKRLEAGLVSEDGLPRLHDKFESRVHRLNILLLFSGKGLECG